MQAIDGIIATALRNLGLAGIDYTDPSVPIEQRRAAFSARAVRMGHRPPEKRKSCKYCADTDFLLVHVDWLMNGEIPRIGVGHIEPSDSHPGQLDITPWVTGSLVSSGIDQTLTRFIPCDTHPGEVSEGKETKSVSKFADFFGQHISLHPFGEAILAYRFDVLERRQDEREVAHA